MICFTCSAPSQGLRHNSPAVPGTVEICHRSALSQTGSHQQQRRDAAIHNSCLVLLKASCHEKRGKWKGYTREFECERGNGTYSFWQVVYHQCDIYLLSLHGFVEYFKGNCFCSFSIIVSGLPLNLCPAFITLIKYVLFDVSF